MKTIQEGNIHLFFPFLLSFTLYTCILSGVLYYTYKHQEIIKKYTSKKDNFLEIALIERKEKAQPAAPQKTQEPKKVEKKIEKKVQEKVEPKITKVEDTPSRSQKENVALKELFGKIETKKKLKQKPIPTSSKSPSRASRLKTKKTKSVQTKKASSIAKSLNFKSSTHASASSVGEYDKFLGEVQEVLDGYWNQTIDTISGASAKVEIDIDNGGNFSYTIVSLSYNDSFNIKLRQFLELMKDVQFPKNKDNKKLGTIVFKDLQEMR